MDVDAVARGEVDGAGEVEGVVELVVVAVEDGGVVFGAAVDVFDAEVAVPADEGADDLEDVAEAVAAGEGLDEAEFIGEVVREDSGDDYPAAKGVHGRVV